MMEPLISVIIPNFNRENVIYETVCNVLEQTYRNIEVIVVDDCSKDGSVEELKKIHDSRFSYVLSEEHRGANACRNEGVRVSHGEYIAFQDSGTLWKNEKLEKQLARLKSCESAGLVYCMIEAEQEGVFTCTPEKALSVNEKEERCGERLAKGNMIDTPTIMVTRSCFEKIGGFDEKLLRWQDYDFVIRVAQNYPIVIVNEVLARTKFFSNSISSNYEYLVQSVPIIIKKNRAFFEKFGGVDDLISGLMGTLVISELPYSVCLDYCNYLDEQLKEVFPDSVCKYFNKGIEKIVNRDRLNNGLVLYNFQNFIKSVHEGKHFLIYGAGQVAQKLVLRFAEIGCLTMIEKIVVTKKDDVNNDEMEGIPVVQIDELEDMQDMPILIGVSEKIQMEIFKILCAKQYKNIITLQNTFWQYIV